MRALFMLFALVLPLTASAGPPGLCLPLEAHGTTPSPGDGPHRTDPSIGPALRVVYTLRYMQASTDPLAHMEALRHAGVGLADSPRYRAELLAALNRRADGGGPLQRFDRGYWLEVARILDRDLPSGREDLDAIAQSHPAVRAFADVVLSFGEHSGAELRASVDRARALAIDDPELTANLDAFVARYHPFLED